MKKHWILIAVIILALILTGCNKEPNKATASYEYDDFTISLEQIVNSDDEIQVDVTLTLPARVTWGNLIDVEIFDGTSSIFDNDVIINMISDLEKYSIKVTLEK